MDEGREDGMKRGIRVLPRAEPLSLLAEECGQFGSTRGSHLCLHAGEQDSMKGRK